MTDFARRLIDWQLACGRHDLPWQGHRDPYRIWVSEIMLQQTQVATVIPYFLRFVERFPSVGELARAPLEDVMAAWSGLGYYARARHLKRAAEAIQQRHGGRLPHERAALEALPGIGRSTAAAIAALAWGERAAILDGNVKRVLARCFAIDGFPGERRVEARLWALAESLLPDRRIEAYTQGIMDLGATVCTRSRPACPACPVRDLCAAHRLDRVADFPSPRPRRAVPERALTVLIVRDADRVLLERRAAAGIWGGLLSLPEAPYPLAAPQEWVHTHLGLEADFETALEPVAHGFTHFRLTLHPLLFRMKRARAMTEPSAGCWTAVGELGRAALPAPIRRLLGELPPAAAPLNSPVRAATGRCG